MIQQDILVFDTVVPVEVRQDGEARWIAAGTYLGKRIEVKGSSADAATALWEKTARNRGE
jgi:hypothetical protein